MNTTDNFPSTNPESRPVKKDYRNAVIGILAAGIIGLGGYLVVDKNKTGEVIKKQETAIATVTDEKSDVQKSFDASLARLDSMSTINTGLEAKLTEKNSEISKVKAEIRSILNKKNATAAELSRAKSLIATLNGKIENMEVEIARLSKDNETLTADKVVLTQEKE
jgi:peptidoglycan hydrolase CwlO-like protein